MKLVVFEWFKKNYNKFYVKLLTVSKKNLKKLHFQEKKFLKSTAKSFAIYLKKKLLLLQYNTDAYYFAYI